MKIVKEKLRIAAFAFCMSTAFGMVACSTGTGNGEVNVEESDAKDKNPNEHNPNENQPQSAVPVDSAEIEDAYEKTDGDKGARDSDNDGIVDTPQ